MSTHLHFSQTQGNEENQNQQLATLYKCHGVAVDSIQSHCQCQ